MNQTTQLLNWFTRMSKKSGDYARDTHYKRFMKSFDNAIKSGVEILDDHARKLSKDFGSSINMIGLGINKPNPTRKADKIDLWKMSDEMKKWIDKPNGLGSVIWTIDDLKSDFYMEALNKEMAKHCQEKYGLFCSVDYLYEPTARPEYRTAIHGHYYQLQVKLYPNDCHKLNAEQLRELNLFNNKD